MSMVVPQRKSMDKVYDKIIFIIIVPLSQYPVDYKQSHLQHFAECEMKTTMLLRKDFAKST